MAVTEFPLSSGAGKTPQNHDAGICLRIAGAVNSDIRISLYVYVTSSPARARSIRAMVRSTPKMAVKEPKRGPWLWPRRTS